MFQTTDDIRIDKLRPLIPPAILMEEIPLPPDSAAFVSGARNRVAEIVTGKSDRLLVVVGPCSIHDPKAALDFANRLKPVAASLSGDLEVVMRVYFEKPRTTVGWKGLINDPHLDGSFEINKGLRTARQLLVDLASMGIPAGTEFLDTITPQFIADAISWGAIGARTTESQVHRELSSGLSMPVGFKNGTGGNPQIAADAVKAARHPHHFLSVTKHGIPAIVSTNGNPTCHLILRGGSKGPNYDAGGIRSAIDALKKVSCDEAGVLVDCSHANSNKDPARQPEVARAVGEQVAAGNQRICGVMIESNLQGGRQDLVDADKLTYGQSITDGCLSFDDTVPVLKSLAEAAQKRRDTKK